MEWGRIVTVSPCVQTEPTPIRPADEPHCVALEPLPPGVAAQIVRAYGEYEIQVSVSIPKYLHALVAEHCVARHSNGCYATYCAEARRWLRDVEPLAWPTAETA